MENAGRTAAQLVDEWFPEGPVAAAIGSGNNGGDALVLLRTLRAWGREVRWTPIGSRRPDPALAHGFDIPPSPDLATALNGAAVAVDGILGTGARGAPRLEAQSAVRALNRSGLPVVALDLPTGVDPDSGVIPARADRAEEEAASVGAHATICFGWPKRGLLRAPARDRCGRIVAVEIGFPPAAEIDLSTPAQGEAPAAAEALLPLSAFLRLPERPFGTHKYQAGTLLVCAGRPGMAGAAVLAARAAIRSGTGLVRVVASAEIRGTVQEAVPDAVFVDRGDAAAVADAAAGVDALLAGPAMGTEAADAAFLRDLLVASEGAPCVLDADALTLVGAVPGWHAEIAAARPVVFTPHPGEFRRLRGGGAAGEHQKSAPEDPVEVARAFANAVKGTLLLKGAPSVVARRGVPVLVDAGGSADFAKAGMGDHLAGLIAGLLAQGATPHDAAAAALGLNALAAARLGLGRGLSPGDLPDAVAAILGEGIPAAPPRPPFLIFDQPAVA